MPVPGECQRRGGARRSGPPGFLAEEDVGGRYGACLADDRQVGGSVVVQVDEKRVPTVVQVRRVRMESAEVELVDAGLEVGDRVDEALLPDDERVGTTVPGIGIPAGTAVQPIAGIVADERVIAAAGLSVFDDGAIGDTDIVTEEAGDSQRRRAAV